MEKKISNRDNPGFYKPLIDEAILKLAAYNNANVTEAAKILKSLKTESAVAMDEAFLKNATKEEFFKFIQENAAEMSALGYLKKSLYSFKDYLQTSQLKAKLKNDWINVLIDPGSHFDDSEELQEETEGNFELDLYPPEAQEALKQGDFMVVEDADILGVWKKDGRETIYHAHPEGFWILGEDAIDWIEKVVSKVYAS